MIEVNVNVYDLTAQNQLLGLVGVGVFHSGVEILGTEHTFGHSDSGTGVFEHEPRAAGGAQYRETIRMGATSLSMDQVRRVLDSLQAEFQGRSYHLLLRNCNHFSEALCLALLRRPLPAFVNRVAYIGGCASCLVPVGWQQALQQAPVSAEGTSGPRPQHRRDASQASGKLNVSQAPTTGFVGAGRRLGD
eukprot:TRINITY_DN32864_c0_g1_i1.p1 TRINITY_DN32864_c0_g1~~TRINITY_DN32864_c0_g1_i1.p1  ORF type:complete len:190 (+),score=33.50 TRINITY_DN32864_c0_g1_i1:136-705(+)